MLNRRQMLGGLLALPLIPTFLKPKKLKPCKSTEPWVIAILKDDPNIRPGFISTQGFNITSHTTTEITATLKRHADYTEPMVIKQIFMHGHAGYNVLNLLSKNSSIEVGPGETLFVTILRYQEKTTATFVLTKDNPITHGPQIAWNDALQQYDVGFVHTSRCCNGPTLKFHDYQYTSCVHSIRFQKDLDSVFHLFLPTPFSPNLCLEITEEAHKCNDCGCNHCSYSHTCC